MISLLFILLASVCNAVMDTLELPQKFDASIFSKWPRSFWSKAESWTRKPLPFTKFTFNGWHIVKSMMIGFMVMAVVSYHPIFVIGSGLVTRLVHMGIYGAVWITGFVLCNDKLFKRKINAAP